jgi:hypothetical protein
MEASNTDFSPARTRGTSLDSMHGTATPTKGNKVTCCEWRQDFLCLLAFQSFLRMKSWLVFAMQAALAGTCAVLS